MSAASQTRELAEDFVEFYRNYYRDDIGTLAQHYPKESRSLNVSYSDLHAWDPDIAENALAKPDMFERVAEDGLVMFDLPADIDLSDAHVRLVDLPEMDTYYPGHFSPSDLFNDRPYLSIRGEVMASSDVYPKIVEATFECQRCGTNTYIPQSDGGFQEPHECQGCERQGPFKVDFDESTFIDAQKIRVSEPPEVASGDGRTIDIYLEDDLAGETGTGDRVTISGKLQLEQRKNGREKKAAFDHYLDGRGLEIEQSDETEIDISPEEREEIQRYASGEEGDALTMAAASLAPKIYGHTRIKEALILSIVEGSWVEHPDGSVDRGSINTLVVGDPGTAKSKLINAAKERAPRAVSVSGKGARVAGITASAVRDDFSDGEWTLKAGAFVKANGGIVRIDELDDMPSDVRAAMLEPMGNAEINVSKAGINATLQTRVGVIAAANPEYGRFDEYEPLPQQVDISPTLLSRFDLVFTVQDKPDFDGDMKIADNITQKRDYAKRLNTDREVSDEAREENAPPVGGDLLTKWLALAKRQPDPVFEDPSVGTLVNENFVGFRNNVDEDAPMPATFRKHEAQLQVAEAIAKLELSDVITERHARMANRLVKKSLEDYATNEDGELEADVVESGITETQRGRKRSIKNALPTDREEAMTIEEIAAAADVDAEKVREEIEGDKGWAQRGDVLFVGREDGDAKYVLVD